jgi:hypothetical protein
MGNGLAYAASARAGGLWAGAGHNPRCIRIFPVCRARHRQVDDLGLFDEGFVASSAERLMMRIAPPQREQTSGSTS